jgi:lipoate-protein ligase A
VNPYFNLAFETYLVRHHQAGDASLYLWQNENTVVIGRNQNPWKECDLDYLKSTEGKLVRRLSGGGAVYHDLGNLNFTFISNDAADRIQKNIGIIIDALGQYGIRAQFSGKNDILAEGYKVSGNAFYTEVDTLCHHGTLLVDVDGSRLEKVLTVSKQKLASKGIDSVKARVKNLTALQSALTVDGLIQRLNRAFLAAQDSINDPIAIDAEKLLAGDLQDTLPNSAAEIKSLMTDFESWEWRFGASPVFNVQINERFPWGTVELYLQVEDGVVKAVTVTSDALEVNLPERIKKKLLGCPYDEAAIKALIS